MRPTPTAAPGIADIKLVDGEICARGPQMLVGYLHPEDETASFDDEGLLPHRRSRPLGRRRLPGGHRPRQGHHHPQRREHLAQGSRRHPRRASGYRRDRGRRRARRAHRRTGVRRHRGRRPTRHPISTDLRELLISEGLAKFKIPEQIVIWDALPKNDAGKVLKHQIRATLTKLRERRWTDMQVAIVTGASSGIGFGCATKLAEPGMAVLGTGRDADTARRTGEGGRRSRAHRHDRRRPDRRRRAATNRRRRDPAVGSHRLPDQQRRGGQPQAAARNRRRIIGLFPGFDASSAVPAGA